MLQLCDKSNPSYSTASQAYLNPWKQLKMSLQYTKICLETELNKKTDKHSGKNTFLPL